MRVPWWLAGAAVTALGALGLLVSAYADGLGLKPGLWEVRLVRQVVDGHDISQQLTESIAKVQTALSKLPPEERARVQGMLKEGGATPDSNATFRICISPEMAADDLPVLDSDNSCRPVLVSRSGNRTSFRMACTANGTHIQGVGEAVGSADMITTRTDLTTRADDGSTHSMHNETQMQFVSANCGSLQPPR